ncbi:MAG: VWA domain-containing protein [Acidobacteriota bacterium]|jgi:Ca-activated chloride channel family protein|nr:VWA domain-containing protein [Acidobacteriota bacterium]
MRLRNNLVLLTAFVFITIAGLAQGIGSTPSSTGNEPQPSPAAPQQAKPLPGVPGQPPQPAASPDATPSEQQAPVTNSPSPSGTQTPESQSQQPEGTPPTADDAGVFVFKKEVQEIVLHATVVDEKNRLITTLDKGAFTVFENSKPQPITDFRHQDVPVAMGIVIDNSGSMREKRDKVNKAAINLVRSSNPDDQVFVVNFNDEFYLDQDYTSDVNKLRSALEKVETRGGTALYDAIVASADHLKKSSQLQRKVLFVVTDGEDNASRESLEQAIRRLQEENGPTVYAIGILGEEKARRARRALEVIADRTGGIAFLPRTVDEVDEISRTVAHDIRSQYTIGYKPATPKSVPGYRAIHVDARAKGYKTLTVRTRTGYYPGQEQANR